MYAVIDLETTGGQPPQDRITEIAIILHDGQQVVDQFQTLVNPERPIPYSVSQLTGITNNMVAEAPRFYQIAKQVVQMTEGCTIVAHNASFDYHFLKAAFSELGYTYTRGTLCTVRLSRKLLPGLPSYSLGKLCQSIGIQVAGRHRAYGDAAATTELLERLIAANAQHAHDVIADDIVADEIRAGLLPQLLDKAKVDSLPELTGVYYFHAADGSILYVGKSINIRKRVLQHFQVDFKRRNHLELKARIADISYEVTGSELLALLLESDEIKRLAPPFNRAQRNSTFRTGIFIQTDAQGYQRLVAREYSGAPAKRDDRTPLIVLETPRRARSFLEGLTNRFSLCPKLMGIEKSRNDVGRPCFNAHIHKCAGPCCGREPADAWNGRLVQALHHYRYPHTDFLIVGRGRSTFERSVVCVSEGRYRGFAYVPEDFAPRAINEVYELLTPYTENKHVQAIIRGYLHQQNGDTIVRF